MCHIKLDIGIIKEVIFVAAQARMTGLHMLSSLVVGSPTVGLDAHLSIPTVHGRESRLVDQNADQPPLDSSGWSTPTNQSQDCRLVKENGACLMARTKHV